MIKTFLKKILPTPLLKQGFLVYNKVKIMTVDRILFPEYRIPTSEFLIYRNGYPFRESQIDISGLPDDDVKTYMKSWNDWTQEEFLLSFNKPCWIEPEFGWAIVEPNKLIYYSLGVSRTWFQKKPNFIRYLRKKNTVKVEKAISLRDSGEENYFHFYNDVLGKLFFLEQHQVDVKKYSIIISSKLWGKEYFRFYFDHSPFLQSLQWVVQDQQYIHTDSALFTKPLTHKKNLWTKVLSPLVKTTVSSGRRKMFLTRSKSRFRFIENMNDVETICRRHGFEIVDTDDLTLARQIELFANTEFLIGIHGAGLTNMAFRSGSCHVLEIFSPPDQGYLPYHYIMLAGMLKFQYRAVIGEPGSVRFSGGFYLSPEKFEAALMDMPSWISD